LIELSVASVAMRKETVKRTATFLVCFFHIGIP
jgi:hypothetical protein